MKINFSNLAKLFLAGVCFVAVGCTDYGQDIENLNNRITALETDTIDPLKADLEKTKETLAEAQKAIADHATQHAADVAALQQADENLQKAINDAAKKAADDLKALADELKAADAKLASDLAKAAEDLQNGIDAVNKKADDNKAAIEKAVADAAAALAALSKELKDADAALSKKIDAAVETLNGEIAKTNASVAALEAALNAAKTALEQSIADAKAELLAADATLKAELESKIATLETALNNTIADLEKKVDAEVARIDAAVQANALSIEALQTALAETDARLQNAIKEGDDKLAADLLETEAKLTQMIQDHVATVEAEIAKIYTEISALKTVDANLQEQINTLVSELATTNANVAANAEAIANNVKAIAQNATDIAANKEAIAANAEAIAKLNEALNAHVAEFLTFKAATEASIADLYVKIEELKAKDVELQGLIEALDVRLTANEALAAQNAADIKANKELFDEFVVATNETLELLKAADVQLQSNIDALDAALKAYQQAIRAELDAHYGEFAAHQAKTEAEFKKVNDAIAANAAAINANAAAIADNKAAIANNATAIAALDARLTDLEKAHADLKAAHESLVADFTAYKAEIAKALASIEAAQLEQDAKIKLNSEQIAALQESVKKLDEKVEKYYTELNNKISELEKSLKAMIEDVAADVAILKGRIQSIVYVPVYTDGMATIEYAMFGNKIIECNSVLTYQVHPANCAAAVKKEDLSFLFQGLKTRAAAAAPELEVVGVKVADATKGTINVTVQAHNLGDNFYQGKAIDSEISKYAVSLVFAHNDAATGVDNNIASCYTTLIAENLADADVISMGILSNEAKEIHAADAQPVEKHEIIYSDTETKVTFMDGCYPAFKINKGMWFTYDQIVSAGYQISVPVQSIAYNYFDKAGVATDAFKSVYNNVKAGEGYAQYVTTNLAKVEKLAVKSYETVTYTYATDGNDVSTTGQLTITKDKGTFNLGEATIDWARNLDNKKVNFVRENIGYVLAEKVLAGKNTSYSEAVAGTLTTLTVNGESILGNEFNKSTTETDGKMAAQLVKVAKDAEPVLKFEGFEWNKTYTFVAVYELDNIDVTINFSVKTVLPLYTITLKPMTITWNYAQDWKSTFGVENTNRVLNVEVDSVVGAPAYAGENVVDPTYAYLFELDANKTPNAVQNSITEPQPSYELSKETIKCTQFDWNKTYNFTTEYALKDALVTINGEVTTVKDLKNITVTLPESTQDILPNLVINTQVNTVVPGKDYKILPINDVLAPSFTEENLAALRLGTTTIEEYLSAIFADASLPVATIEASKRSTNDAATDKVDTTDTTKLAVVADGQSIDTYFNYADGYSPIPSAVVYNLTVKTWYGVEITFVKKLNFVLNTYNQYDYQSVPEFVFTLDGLYFSNALPYYTYSDGVYVNQIDVLLNMNTAFNVIDKDGALVAMTDGKNDALGLVSTFAITNKYGAHGNGIVLANNNLRYHDRDEHVGVKATLTVVNSDGTLVATIPTEFDEFGKDVERKTNGIYYQYEVRKYDPIQKFVDTPGIQFNVASEEAKEYHGYVMNGFQIKDQRGAGFNLIKHGVLTEEPNKIIWSNPSWLIGNSTAENGYATGADVTSNQLYSLKVVSMDYASSNDRALVQELVNAGALTFDTNPDRYGYIVFDNNNQIQLTRSITFNVKVLVDYTWGVREFNVPVTLNKVSK